MSDFVAFPKIGRLNKGFTITEKIDGTNAAVGVRDDGTYWCQSRNRIITPEDDNYGFARWVESVADDLIPLLGPGIHFGEWYGRGIQRCYGLYGRKFALFNSWRWMDLDMRLVATESLLQHTLTVVPVLAVETTAESVAHINHVVTNLKAEGSRINPEYPAEGIMLFFHGSNSYIKHPFDSTHKGNAA